jgi:hypothetical protein
MSVHKFLISITAFLFVSTFSYSQSDTLRVLPDSTVKAIPFIQSTGLLPDTVLEDRGISKSPWLAVGMSAVLPGAGQIYTENYWKVPVIWGLGGYWMYEWGKQNKLYKDFRDRYSASIVLSPPYGNDKLRVNRDFYRDQRDSFAWYMGFLYFLNLVDAYVGAHLYDFDVSPDLTADGRVVPKMNAKIHIRF